MNICKYTLYLIPGNNEDTRVLSVSKPVLIAACCIIAFFVIFTMVSGILLLNLYSSYRTVCNNYERELSNNLMLRNDIKLKSDHLIYVDQKVEHLNELSSRLFMMAGLSSKIYEYTASGSGRGGQSANDFKSNENSYRLYYLNLISSQTNEYIESLIDQVDALSEKYSYIESIITENNHILSHIPTLTPTSGYISSSYGYRRSPFTGRREFHKGIDISAPKGTQIVAPADGKVVYTGYKTGFGNTLIIEHDFGYVTQYAHLDDFAVKKWQNVKRGELIGYVGNSGRSTGPHLHYEVLFHGVNVNPARYFFDIPE